MAMMRNGKFPQRELARLVVLRACADVLMPYLPARAAEERAAGNEALARSFETSGGHGNMVKVSRHLQGQQLTACSRSAGRRLTMTRRFWS